MNRRNVLRAGLATGVGSIVGGVTAGGAAEAARSPAASARRRVARVAHLTDTHVQPERGAADAVRKCLGHIGALPDKPDLIVTGGDLIMSSFAEDEARTRLQWDLFTRTFRDHSPVPVRHTLGNHDIWGWNRGRSRTTGTEPRWGKAWAVEALQLEGPYSAFDLKTWRVLILDSVQFDPDDPNGYIGAVDPAQMDWIRRELEGASKAGRHTMVVSHIPILAVSPLLAAPDAGGDRRVPGGLLMTDSAAVLNVFDQNPTVRVCLSGHLHRIDEVRFRGITYLCNGAVSGSWWNGPHAEAIEGYALVDLFDDGTVERTYVTYGWAARQ